MRSPLPFPPWSVSLMNVTSLRPFTFVLGLLAPLALSASSLAQPPEQPWLYSTARAIPKETTSEGSGYFSIIEGKNAKIYVGTAKYRHNAYLVEYDPALKQMQTVVDCQRAIGTTATGFAAQAKIHTRNNIGPSGKIYFGTKQGYPSKDESVTDYPGGYPMVYDPETQQTRVYPIPIKHQGIISVTPDEARKIAYISTCSDERPVESAHFMILDLEKGTYRDLVDTQHMYGFIVLDNQGRAYHPLRGGEIGRYDPKTDTFERLKQTIDGAPPTNDSHLADPDTHPINWEVSPDRKTLYAIALSSNQLYAYDLTAKGDVLPGRQLGKLHPTAIAVDCRALCVAPNGMVWAGVAITHPNKQQFLHIISYKNGEAGPVDHGPLAIGNPDYTTFTDRKNQPLPWHHGVYRYGDGNLVPRYAMLGICAARDGTIYATTLAPFTLHEIRIPRPRITQVTPRKPVAGITTVYRHNSHSDLILGRVMQTESLDGRGRVSSLKMMGLYVDQFPTNDTSRRITGDLGVGQFKSIGETLTLGQNKLAVDGVLLVAEHGDYPESPSGATQYPKRKMFAEIFATVDRLGHRGMSVFCDKHLADTWTDAKWIYDEAQKRGMPLMAGSSLPSAWRDPPVDVPRGAKLKQIQVVSYHKIDIYGFHALEGLQALAERRAGGETGVAAVQTISGDDVWKAGEQGVYDKQLFAATLAALRERPIPAGKTVAELAKKPVLCVIDYRDGLRACMFTLDGAIAEWAAAWKDADDRVTSTAFVLQENRPFAHFAVLLNNIEQFMQTGQPNWPVERTLLTSGLVDDLLLSRMNNGARRETPHLDVRYTSHWNWSQPIAPPTDRPYSVQ